MGNTKNTPQQYLQRLQKTILSWKDENVLLYGAGEHSRALLKKIFWEDATFIGFVDRSRQRQQQGFLGYPVFSPEHISKTGATKSIISSFSFQEEIYKKLLKMDLTTVDIVKLYTDQDILDAITAKYAYCPGKKKSRSNKSVYYTVPSKDDHFPKILLIHPPFSIANHRHKKILPMNLLSIAGYVMKKNPNIVMHILDGQIGDLTTNEMTSIITQTKWDIIGIGYWTGQAPSAFELSRFIREETDSFLVHGGAHPTLCPEEATPFCDLVVMNEGEETI